MKQFYNIFSDEKVSPFATQLTWSHYRTLLTLKDDNEIDYLISICVSQSLSVRQLINKIKSNEYKRLDEKTKVKLKNKEETKVEDLIKNPIIIKNNSVNEEITEYALKQLILNNLDDFLL